MRHRAEVLLYTDAGYLVERLGSPRYPASVGLLRCPGGKIENGEDPRDTIYREFWEEYGIGLDSVLSLVYQIDGPRGQIVRYTAPAQEHWAGKLDIEEGTSMLVLTNTVPSPWR